MSRKIILPTIFVLFVSSLTFGQTKQPKTVREFFNILPQKYFTLEGCDRTRDRNCEKARRQYLENYLEIEDTANGFWKSGCDGGQSCLTMALFKRPDNTYIVALMTEFESGFENYFLDYKNGKWTDISAKVVPDYSRNRIYELPQRGTIIQVFAKDSSNEMSEKGKKLYDLVWKNGKFSVKK